MKAQNSASRSRARVTPAAMAWPPPLIGETKIDAAAHGLTDVDAT